MYLTQLNKGRSVEKKNKIKLDKTIRKTEVDKIGLRRKLV